MIMHINSSRRFPVCGLHFIVSLICFWAGGYFSAPALGDTSLTWHYAYDAEGRIAEIQSPAGNIHYEYSQITGRKTATWTGTDPQNQFNRTEYTYDPLGRLEEVRAVRCNGAALNPAYITRYDYNKVGSVETITYPNGFHSVYEYNALNRLTVLTHYLSAQPGAMMLSRYEYMYYADGMRATAKETLWNKDTESYDYREVQWKYDNLNRVTEEHLLGGYTLGFVYDLTGNCLRRTLDGVTTYFFYNERDELLKESLQADGSDPTVEYEYDANGSMTRKVDHVTGREMVYEYNLQNRLRAVLEDGQAVASYLYHPDGYRLGKEAGGTMVWYLSDPYNPTGYVQVLEEVTGSSTTTYFLGLHVLGQKTDLDDPMFYLPDGQGSTRQTVQAPVTASPPTAPTMQQIHYDAYGKQIPGAVPPGTNVLYRNQRYDPHLNMYDLRRREYDPANMRFTQHDPFAGSIDDPMSLHRYLYCNANPVNCYDPSGEFSIMEIPAVQFIIKKLDTPKIRMAWKAYNIADVTTETIEFIGQLYLTGTVNPLIATSLAMDVTPFGKVFKTIKGLGKLAKIGELTGTAADLTSIYRRMGKGAKAAEAIGELGAEFTAAGMKLKKAEGFEAAYHGIDSIYKNKKGVYVIVEAKGGAGSLGKTVDGAQQMSKKWIEKNILKVGKQNPDLANELYAQFKNGTLETMVVYTKLDGAGNVLDPVYEMKNINQVGQWNW
jgi:RHS repeat-associated protein